MAKNKQFSYLLNKDTQLLLPLALAGTVSSPSVKLNTKDFEKNIARNASAKVVDKLTDKLPEKLPEKLKNKLNDGTKKKIQDGLKNLFGH